MHLRVGNEYFEMITSRTRDEDRQLAWHTLAPMDLLWGDEILTQNVPEQHVLSLLSTLTFGLRVLHGGLCTSFRVPLRGSAEGLEIVLDAGGSIRVKEEPHTQSASPRLLLRTLAHDLERCARVFSSAHGGRSATAQVLIGLSEESAAAAARSAAAEAFSLLNGSSNSVARTVVFGDGARVQIAGHVDPYQARHDDLDDITGFAVAISAGGASVMQGDRPLRAIRKIAEGRSTGGARWADPLFLRAAEELVTDMQSAFPHDRQQELLRLSERLRDRRCVSPARRAAKTPNDVGDDVFADRMVDPPDRIRPFRAAAIRRFALERAWTLGFEERVSKVVFHQQGHRSLLVGAAGIFRLDVTTGAVEAVVSSPGAFGVDDDEKEGVGGYVHVRGADSDWMVELDSLEITPLSRNTRSIFVDHMSDVVPLSQGALVLRNGGTPMLADAFGLTAIPGVEVPAARLFGDREQGLAFVARSDGSVDCLDIRDGKQGHGLGAGRRLQVQIEGRITNVRSDGTSIVVVSEGANDELNDSWFDAKSGESLWVGSSRNAANGWSEVVVSNGQQVFISQSEEGELRATSLDPNVSRPSLRARLALSSRVRSAYAASDVIVLRLDDSIIAFQNNGRVEQPLWEHQLVAGGGAGKARVAVHGDVVAIAHERLVVLDAWTGRELFGAPGFWEECAGVSVDGSLSVTVAERMGTGGRMRIHRLECRALLAPVTLSLC